MTLQSGRAWCLGGGLVKAPAVTGCNQGTDARAMVGPGRTLDDARPSAYRPVLRLPASYRSCSSVLLWNAQSSSCRAANFTFSFGKRSL